MPVAVRNLKRTIAVFSHVSRQFDAIEWAPAGDPAGNDIQQLPEELATNPRFLRAVGIGIFEVLEGDDPALAESIMRQAQTYARGQAADEDATLAFLERTDTGREKVFTEADMAAHIDSLSKGKGATINA